MTDRYTYDLNTDPTTNIYRWVVRDTREKRIVAFVVTEHTARAFCRTLNEEGYIEAI